MKDLPPFKKRNRDDVLAYIKDMLVNERSGQEALIDLIDYQDGHYRAVFDPRYFTLQEGQTEPTKSQWNSLKKKLKRHESTVFVFKDHGEVGTESKRYYLDFGFLPDLP
jgi:hypothetical protein